MNPTQAMKLDERADLSPADLEANRAVALKNEAGESVFRFPDGSFGELVTDGSAKRFRALSLGHLFTVGGLEYYDYKKKSIRRAPIGNPLILEGYRDAGEFVCFSSSLSILKRRMNLGAAA